MILLLLNGRKQNFMQQRMLPSLIVPLPHLLIFFFFWSTGYLSCNSRLALACMWWSWWHSSFSWWSSWPLTDEMCQMNTRIGYIDRHQSRLGGFAPSLERDSLDTPSNSGDDAAAVAFGSSHDDEMTTSQWFILCPSWQKWRVVLRVVRPSW